MNMRPSVSAVVPTYNGERYIEETLQSLVNQKRPFQEIIIADDGSTDKTVALCRTFAKKHKEFHFQVINHHHVGRVAIRNVGWKAAKGEIIAFIDSDLLLVPEWLEEVMKGFSQGYKAVVDRRAVYQPKTYIARLNDHFFDLRFTDDYEPFTAWVVERRLLEDIGGLDAGVEAFEDVDLADGIFARGEKIYFAKDALAYHRGEPISLYEEMRRNFWFGSYAWSYWRKTRKMRKPVRFAFFSGLFILLFFQPVLFVTVFLALYGYVLVKDMLRGMHVKYLFVHPFIGVLAEFFYAAGAWYGLLHGPLVVVRPRDVVKKNVVG